MLVPSLVWSIATAATAAAAAAAGGDVAAVAGQVRSCIGIYGGTKKNCYGTCVMNTLIIGERLRAYIMVGLYSFILDRPLPPSFLPSRGGGGGENGGRNGGRGCHVGARTTTRVDRSSQRRTVRTGDDVAALVGSGPCACFFKGVFVEPRCGC